MNRTIMRVNEALCNGCGRCADVCVQQAIIITDKRARLIDPAYCSGRGRCAPICPLHAIDLVRRQVPPYNETAVRNHLSQLDNGAPAMNWPIKLRLAPLNAPFFQDCDLVIAADCTAFVHGGFKRFTEGKIVLILCAKFDEVDYTELLTRLFSRNRIHSIQVVRMDAPCCGGLAVTVRQALEQAGKKIPVEVTVISSKGRVN